MVAMNTHSPALPLTKETVEASIVEACLHGYHFCKRCQRVTHPNEESGCELCGAHYVHVRFYPAIPIQ